MPKCKGTKNGPKAPWKADLKAKRREEAEKRQAAFDALPVSEKRRRNPKKEYA